MTKRTRRLAGLLMGLLMVLSIILPTVAMAASPRPDKGNLHIHKVQTNYDPFNDALITNDGLSQDLPADATFLEGAEFSVYRVADDADITVDVSELTPIVKQTDENGLALFNNLPKGRYYVVETDTPKGVEEFSGPFLVDVPMMNPDGREWNKNVHVYPKNQLILGAVELIKWAEDGKTGLPGAEFSLFKVGKHADEEIASELTTGTDGKIFVGDLVVGNYYFVETRAPEGYGLNKTPIPFEVTKSDHAYGVGNNLGNLVDDKVIREGVALVNYDLPEINKYVTSMEQLYDSADFFETVTWIIRADVPGDIKDAESFVITDTFGKALTYDGNLTVLADNQAFSNFSVSGVTLGSEGGSLVLDFDVDALDGVDELIISFDTFINENAIMGLDYENEVKLDFNNGHHVYTSRPEENPFVHTGGKAFIKINTAHEALEGAEFVIHNGNGKYLQSDYTWGSKGTARVFKSKADGTFDVKGLAYGDYYLEETKAPNVGGVQYRLLEKDFKFTVNANSYYTDPSAITSATADPTAESAKIKNSPEMKLPQTGGMGTLVFSLLGIGLMGTSAKLYKKVEKK
ncbi:LPXTG cell wall anchor domain-containing protein [Alkalibacterium iburiense]|uniref:LPXTG cell wall anchor domain-containing protein n=1 Tax=Alkalibacterium iburiense TaxID=290589 RepID=A0ABP3HIX9_9LACT